MKHFLNLVQEEVDEARRSAPPIASDHEGYAVIREELDELWDDIRRKNPDKEARRDALVQIAALCCRCSDDLKLLWDGNPREPLEVSRDRTHTDRRPTTDD